MIARREGRVLPVIPAGVLAPEEFQSSPAPKDGCYKTASLSASSLHSFQSSPAPKDGCYAAGIRGYLTPGTFQSSPAPKDGCYTLGADMHELEFVVSILTRPEGRVLLVIFAIT